MSNKLVIVVLAVVLLFSVAFSALLIVSLKETTPNVNPEVTDTTDEHSTGTEGETATETESTQTADTETETSDPSKNEGLIKAPDINVYDLNGNPVKLSEHFGKPIVLNFWASWCGPCTGEMPDFHEVYQELNGEVLFLMVNRTDGVAETVRSATNHIIAKGYTFPVFLDKDNEARQKYSVDALPSTFFINEDGYIVSEKRNSMKKAELLERIEGIYQP